MAKGPKRESRARRTERLLAQAMAVEVPTSCDVLVVGGGAAGLACAITAAEAGSRVVVAEGALECGRTILATGGGRCNFSTVELGPDAYNDPDFVGATFGERPLDDVLDFFGACGLMWALEEDRLYPRSMVAASVRDVLVARAEAAGVSLACGRRVEGLVRDDEGLVAALDVADGSRAQVRAKCVVLASGGRTAEVVQGLGLVDTQTRPGLVPLACEDMPLLALSGRRMRCSAYLRRGEFPCARERGEVLLRDYGLSGIAILNLSRLARPGDIVELDLVDDRAPGEVERALEAPDALPARTALAGMIDPQVADALLDMAESGWTCEGASFETGRLASLVRRVPFRVTGTANEDTAQVSLGGLELAQFDPVSLAAREVSGLYACGEVLDVDGPCGGYNLSWAWLSGIAAGRAAAAQARGSAC